MSALDLTGQRFGRGVVLGLSDRVWAGNKKLPQGKNRVRFWKMRCDCETEYEASTGALKQGHNKSCGCLMREAVAENARKFAIPACTKPPGVAAFNQLLAGYKKGAREHKREWRLTDEEFRGLIFGDCHYCGQPPSRVWAACSTRGPGHRQGTSIVTNGVDRADNSVGYTPENCVPCCKQCNTAKNTMTSDDFLAWIERVHVHVQKEG